MTSAIANRYFTDGERALLPEILLAAAKLPESEQKLILGVAIGMSMSHTLPEQEAKANK